MNHLICMTASRDLVLLSSRCAWLIMSCTASIAESFINRGCPRINSSSKRFCILKRIKSLFGEIISKSAFPYIKTQDSFMSKNSFVFASTSSLEKKCLTSNPSTTISAMLISSLFVIVSLLLVLVVVGASILDREEFFFNAQGRAWRPV